MHGERHPELLRLSGVIEGLQQELQSHMFKEEQILFPAIRQLERSAELPRFPFGTVANPIRMMEHEHDSAGQALEQIRDLTDGFRALAMPVEAGGRHSSACRRWKPTSIGISTRKTTFSSPAPRSWSPPAPLRPDPTQSGATHSHHRRQESRQDHRKLRGSMSRAIQSFTSTDAERTRRLFGRGNSRFQGGDS